MKRIRTTCFASPTKRDEAGERQVETSARSSLDRRNYSRATLDDFMSQRSETIDVVPRESFRVRGSSPHSVAQKRIFGISTGSIPGGGLRGANRSKARIFPRVVSLKRARRFDWISRFAPLDRGSLVRTLMNCSTWWPQPMLTPSPRRSLKAATRALTDFSTACCDLAMT